MLPRIFRHVQTHKARCGIVGRLFGKGKFGIDDLDTKLAGAVVEALEDVRALQHEIHAFAVAEVVVEEGGELHDFLLPQHLETHSARFPFLVDGDDHSSSGDCE